MKKSKGNKRKALFILTALLIAAAVGFVTVVPRILESQRYPVKLEKEIRAASAVYGIDPALIASIVNTESAYNPAALSRAGARGLMQIMPATGEWIHSKLKAEGSFDRECLFDAETSLAYGCWYVDFLLRRYDGEMVPAVAAYHAGQGNVDAWLKNAEYSFDGRTLSRFPKSAPATEHYVNKVKDAYEYYKKAYAR